MQRLLKIVELLYDEFFMIGNIKTKFLIEKSGQDESETLESLQKRKLKTNEAISLNYFN